MNHPPGMAIPRFVFIAACLFLLLIAIALPRHWRGASRPYDYMTAGYIYGSRRLREGHVRALPVLFAWWTVLCSFVVLSFFSPQPPPGKVEDPYFSWGILDE